MTRIELERFFGVPISQAPNWNSKPHNEMGKNHVFPSRFEAPGFVRAMRHATIALWTIPLTSVSRMSRPA